MGGSESKQITRTEITNEIKKFLEPKIDYLKTLI